MQTIDIALLISFSVLGWVGMSILGTQAYFRGEQTKPIHERNWRSQSFARIAKYVTGQDTDYSTRVPAYGIDAYASNQLPES